jgi:hypothetical protein
MSMNEKIVNDTVVGSNKLASRQIACQTKEGGTLFGASVTADVTEAVPRVLAFPLRAARHAANAALKFAGLQIVVG